MKKYLAVLKNSFQANLIYRFNFFFYFLSQFISFGILFYIWTSIYYQGGKIGSYELADMIFYYLGAIFIGVVAKGMDVAWQIGDEIRMGQLNAFLLTPINYFWRKFFSFFGGMVFRSFVASLLFITGLYFLAEKFNFQFSLAKISSFLFLVFLSYLLNWLIFYIVGISTFWFGFVWALNYSVQVTANFLEGGLIPLDLLPSWLNMLNNFLPFKYIIFVPVSIFTGRLEITWSIFIIPLVWVLFLYLLAKLLFKVGLKKYEGFGG